MSDRGDQERVIPDAERARALLEQLRSVHALDIGRDLVIAIVNFCTPKLGLSDETRPVRDLRDVRASIELVRAVLGVLDAEYDVRHTSDLHDTLAQLQLAYAHAVQLENAERGVAEAAAAEAPEAAAEQAAAPDEPAEEPVAQESAARPAAKAAAAKRPAAKKKPAARKSAATKPAADKAPKEPAAGKATPRKPAAKKKPATRKRPAGES